MNNLFFKSSTGLKKNDTINSVRLDTQLKIILTEQRHQRNDLYEIKRMINRLLIDKHLQMQVDNYFDEDKDYDGKSPEKETVEQ